MRTNEKSIVFMNKVYPMYGKFKQGKVKCRKVKLSVVKYSETAASPVKV